MVGSAANLIDAASGDLVLQVRGTTRDGQMVRIRSGKCTIGFGPRCTLRLHARGVRPLHCLIVCGSKTTVIRRWAPDTRLNGHTFTDAELVPGDRLSVGPIELSVVQTGGSAKRQPAAVERAASPPPAPSLAQTQLLDPLNRRLTEATQQGRKRARRLLEQLRQARREIARLQQQAPQPSEPSEPPERAGTEELEAQQAAFQQQRHRWEAERDEAGRQLDRRASELEAKAADLEARKQALQDYMARLLDRVRGVAGETRRPPPAPARPEPAATPRPSADEVPPEPQPEAPRPRPGGPKQRGSVDMSPRAVAPEKTMDLSAMRALANSSAQSAIDRYSQQKTVSAIRAKLLVTILGLAVGSFTAWMWWAKDAPRGVLYAAVAAFAVAGFWAVQYLVMAGALMVRRSRGRRQIPRGEAPHSIVRDPAGTPQPAEPSRAETSDQAGAAGQPDEEEPTQDEAPEAPSAQQPPPLNDSRRWHELERAASGVDDEPTDEA